MGQPLTMKDLKNGTYLDIDGVCWVVIRFEHVKPGKGKAFVRTRMKSMQSGQVVDRTVRSGDTLMSADVQFRKMSYLYTDGADRHFMDQTNYEQAALPDDLLGDASKYLLESMEVDVVIFNGTPIGVNIPVKVDLKVTATVPGAKGDTVSNVTKDAEVETGITVQVPLFINEGDVVTVDTRDGSYVTRASTA
jgi:elongation factor P